MRRSRKDLPRELTGADASMDEAMAPDADAYLTRDGSTWDEAPDLRPDQIRWLPGAPRPTDGEDESDITARPADRPRRANLA